jgi:hypothetical protein
MATDNHNQDASTLPTEMAIPTIAAPAAAPAPAAPKQRRRRKVKLAPPPKSLSCEVGVAGHNTVYTGFEGTIDSGGLFVVTLETLPVGHELELEFSINGKPFRSRARVEFVRVDNYANPECVAGAGFKLLSLTPDARAALDALGASRAPMFLATNVG